MATYYISNSGDDDTGDGSVGNPYATITKVNSLSFSSGDSILFNKGDVWREPLIVSDSGISESHITYGAYGTGNRPKFLGSESETSWTEYSSNIWVSDNTFNDPTGGSAHDGSGYGNDNEWPGSIWFVESNNSVSWGHQQKYMPLTNLTQEYDWVWDSDHIYIYSSTDPNARYNSVEVAQRENCIKLNNKEYITIDGLETRFFKTAGIDESYPVVELNGLIITNFYSSYSGIKGGRAGYGVNVFHSNMLVENCVMHDNGRRNLSNSPSSNNGLSFHDITINHNILYNGYHTTGVDFGHSGNCSFEALTISNNLIYEDLAESQDGIEGIESYGIFVGTTSDIAPFTNVLIYNNVILNTTACCISLENVNSANVYNNTLYGVHPELYLNVGMVYILNNDNTHFYNNIIYNNLPDDHLPRCQNLNIRPGNAGVYLDYNLYYKTDPNNTMISYVYSSYKITDWASYKSTTVQDANSPTPADPIFTSSSDYHLQSGSPAIGAGINVGLSTDYAGNLWNATPSIGAYEYGSNSDDLTLIEGTWLANRTALNAMFQNLYNRTGH